MFPIKPGQRNYLAGNMGELRPNHFHAGIDIKTDGVEGLPVYAAADGYIHRIVISSYGYGNVLYITHPNGYKTTYAHLKDFHGKLASYIREQQYIQEKFNVELYPNSTLFPVKKGDTVAYSGNTGSSGGPHLHFEIRDKNDVVLNPLKFGFSEVIDEVKPDIHWVALTPLNTTSRIAEKYERKGYKAVFNGSEYIIKDKIQAYGTIGLSINSTDRLSGAHNRNGISEVEVIFDNVSVFKQNITHFEFAHNRSFNCHIDYESYRKLGVYYQNCYVEDGNKFSIYETKSNNGRISINDELEHKVTIIVKDAYENEQRVNFTIQGKRPTVNPPMMYTIHEKPSLTYENHKNTLIIKAKYYDELTSTAIVYTKNYIKDIQPAYHKPNEIIYLWDLRTGIPDSMDFCGNILKFNYKEMVPSGASFSYYDKNYSIYFQSKSLFDTLYLDCEMNDGVCKINNIYTPLFQNTYIKMKWEKPLINKDKAHVYQKSGKHYSFIGGNWINENTIKFKSKSLGEFTVREDVTAPYLKLFRKYSTYLSFKISDYGSGISHFRGELNGKYYNMYYDHKKQLIWTDNPEKKHLKGLFHVKVWDKAGNMSEYKINL